MGQERNTTANYDGLFIAKLSKKPLVMTCSFFAVFHCGDSGYEVYFCRIKYFGHLER